MHALCYKMSDISSYAFVMLTQNICKLKVFAINGKYLFFEDCTQSSGVEVFDGELLS